MAVKIRLSRIGKKHVPFFRIVAIDSRAKRDGQFLENLGTYDALKGTLVVFNEQLYDKWIARGAIPTDSAKKIYRTHKKNVAKPARPVETAVETNSEAVNN